MTDHHDPSCPVMEIGCHSVGGYSIHHNRGRAGDCRCGKKCECALIVRVRAEEREKKMAAADIVFLENVGLGQRLEALEEALREERLRSESLRAELNRAQEEAEDVDDIHDKILELPTRGVGARVVDGEMETYALVERDEVLALFNGGSK